MADTSSFESMFAAVQQLPPTWGPRREQPEWDRDFGGNADIKFHFSHRTDTAHMWMAFALNFSETLIGGFEGLENVVAYGRGTLQFGLSKGSEQFED